MTFLDTPPRLTENQWLAEVRRLARITGWGSYHTHRSDRSEPGFPDLVLVRRPRVIFAELKADRGRVTTAQRAWLNELRACGQEAYLWRPSQRDAIVKLLA